MDHNWPNFKKRKSIIEKLDKSSNVMHSMSLNWVNLPVTNFDFFFFPQIDKFLMGNIFIIRIFHWKGGITILKS